MLKLFKKTKKDTNTERPLSTQPSTEVYNNSELLETLKDDGITLTEQEIQKAKENDPQTLYKIGDIYYKMNKKKSFAWFHKAALQEHEEAQAQVGWMYRHGLGVSQDYQQAMDWLMRAASTGNVKGQYQVGSLYHSGWGVPQDYKKAAHWYLKAAKNGHTKAMCEIGVLYKYGWGVPINIPTAIEWYKEAASQGNKYAQNSLGYIYQNEVGFQDLQKAVNWYQKAADSNVVFAKERAKDLNKKGYYAQEEQTENERKDEMNDINNTINDANIEKRQPATTSTDSEPNGNQIERLVDTLELRMDQSDDNPSTDDLQEKKEVIQHEQRQQHKQMERLEDKLARLLVEDDAMNDLNYDSSDNDNDLNYDSECSSISDKNNEKRQE